MRRRRCASNTGWLTVAEAAQRAGVCELTIRRWIERGGLEASRPGHAYRIWEDNLEEFLRKPPPQRQAKATQCQDSGREELNAIREVAGLPPLPPMGPYERGRLQLRALAEIERRRPGERLHERIQADLLLGDAALRREEALREAGRRRGEIDEWAQRLGVDGEDFVQAFVEEYWRCLGRPATALILAARKVRVSGSGRAGTGMDLFRLHHVTLRMMCRHRGLDDAGTRDELIARLSAWWSPSPSLPSLTGGSPLGP